MPPKATEYVNRFYEHNTWLLKYSLVRGRLLYNVVIKTRLLFHVAERSKWMNPCSLWAYDAEDYMHIVVTLARPSIHSTPMRLIGNKIMQNHAMALELLLRN